MFDKKALNIKKGKKEKGRMKMMMSSKSTRMILLALALGLMISMTACQTNPSNQVFADCQPEHFRFMVSGSASDIDQLNAANDQLKSKYGFISELVRKKFIQQMVFDREYHFDIKLMPKSINIPVFLTGMPPSAGAEIGISHSFAEKNGLQIGSYVRINSQDYVMSGTYIAPDEAENSPDTNAGILMLEDDFEAVNKGETVYFAGRFLSIDKKYINTQISDLSKEENILYASKSSE